MINAKILVYIKALRRSDSVDDTESAQKEASGNRKDFTAECVFGKYSIVRRNTALSVWEYSSSIDVVAIVVRVTFLSNREPSYFKSLIYYWCFNS